MKTPRVPQSTNRLETYWWNTRRNYGDLLTPLLVDKMLDSTPIWTPIEEAELIVVGSIIDLIPEGWDGTILGAGLLHEEKHPNLRSANILAIRGKLTANRIKRHNVAMGDPGLLCSEFIPAPDHKQFDLTVVPHWSDHGLAARFAHLNPHVIDPASDTADVIADIAASKKVVASSLHGIIIADSYGIPRRAEQHPNMFHRYEGGTFKYEDYASALNDKVHWGELHTPNQRHINRAQAELFDAFRPVVGR